MSNRLRLADGTSWSAPDFGDESVGWKLRYAPHTLTEADRMRAAAIISDYGYLFEPSMTAASMGKKVAMLRRAYRESE